MSTASADRLTSSFPAAGPSEDRSPDTAPLGRRWLLGTLIAAFLLTFLQAPGFTVADTKYDLAQNPLGFLARASHLWSSQAPMGQVQNQAYGYFFPHGAFFSLGHVLGLPGWVTQRIWWALLLLAGFWGIIRLCEILGIGSRGSRIIAALAFALSPRVLTTLGSISSETAPMMLAPWVLLAPAALGVVMHRRGASEVTTADTDLTSAAAVPPARAGLRGLSAMWPRRGFGRGNRTRATTSGSRRVWLGAATPAGSALALALMGSVNAVATAAAFLPAALWWISFKPNRAWWRFTRAWIPLLALGTFWWVLPLLLLGKVSPPFLDFIESSGVTTQWASLGEVLRGTDSWTPFVSPERIAGAVLVTQPAAVLATGMLAAAGMAGLAMRSMPARGRLTLILCVGLVGICAGYAGDLGGPFADSVRTFLDSGGAPLRNVHKLEPLIRLPLVLGLAQLLSRVPLPASVPMPVWRSAFAHPERNRMVAVAGLILTALALSTSLAWTGKLAPRGAYDEVPGYWHRTADWLAHNAADARALVVPGAPFGTQTWGLTRDEPLQALASTPWAVRDSVPLVPPGAIRAMDSVQRLIADGRPSASLAPTLAGQGIGILVLRNDLDPETSRSTRPLLAHEAIEGSPGIRKVAQFGDPIETGHVQGLVADEDLRPTYPAVEIYRVETGTRTGDSADGAHTDGSADGGHADGSAAGTHTGSSAADAAALADSGGVGVPADIRSGTGAPGSFPGAFTVPLDGVPVVQGGPEVVERLRRDPSTPPGPILLDSDAKQAGLPVDSVTITDTPMDREADFGRVDNHNSALRAPGDPRRTHNLVPDYPVPGAKLVEGEWSGATVTVSSAAGDATQLGGAAPGSSSAAAVDGDPSTAWISNGAEHAVGQWLRLDLQRPVSSAVLRLTTSAAAIGSPVKWVEVATAKGTVSARITAPGEPVAISLPPGNTSWIKVTAAHTEDGSGGGQFGISELSVDDYSNRDNPVTLDIRHRTVLPPAPAGAQVQGWDLGQEFPGRSACFDAPDRVRCSKGLALAAEEPGLFERTLDVPQPLSVTPGLTVHTRPGPALEALLTDPDRPVARGQADVADPRGSAFAATDGDPRTAWIAPETTVRNPTGAKPTLTIELPAPTLVTGLEVTPAQGDLPAHPTSVAVNLGDGPQIREIDPKSGAPTRIDLHPRVTDRIELSIQTWDPVLDQTALGFAQEQPPGLADVNVLGPGYPAPAPADRLLTVDCAHGPTIAAAGRTLHTTITATAAQLISGAPLPATVCDTGDATTPPGITTFDLPTGKIDVTVAPGDLFTVDDLRLDRAPAVGRSAADRTAADPQGPGQSPSDQPSSGEPAATQPPAGQPDPTQPDPTQPDPTQPAAGQPDPAGQGGSAGQENPGMPGGAQRATTDLTSTTRPDIGAPAGTRLLVLPLSTNVGWQAKTAGGQTLEPVVINGWQQAWLMPPGTQGPITVSFPVDRWYRLSIFGGLLLLIPLLVFAVRAARAPVRDDGPAPRTWRSRAVAAIGLTAAAGLISGPAGIVLAALGVSAYRYRPPTWPRVLVWIAFAGTAISAAALSTGPWRSPDGYMGGSLWVQFPALVAVVAVGLAALPDQRE